MNSNRKIQSCLVNLSYFVVCSVLVLIAVADTSGQSQTPKVKMIKAHSAEIQRPLFREYRGVRLSMSMEETRAKLGNAAFKSADLDVYVLSPNETAQIAYSAAHKVVTISVDYIDGVGAPDYQTVVGMGLQERPDGSLYRMVEYESEGFWVSYNKSSGTVAMVTITLQASVK